MKKAFSLAVASSFFFAFTFILNRSMHNSGGSWVWSASLRYLFTFPILAAIVWRKYGFKNVHGVVFSNLKGWLIWGTVGFGLFYAPLSFAGNYGESWLIAASWQITIVMGIFMAPLFGGKIPLKNLGASAIILFGVFLMQAQSAQGMEVKTTLLTLVPILLAATAYPLGNRKAMQISGGKLSTIERTYAMTLCSLPFWILLSVYGICTVGAPSGNQVVQSLCVAVFSGVVATLLFFAATDMVKTNQKQLALIESTQSGEVIFTLLGGTVLLGDPLPSFWGAVGILLIVAGMVINSLVTGREN